FFSEREQRARELILRQLPEEIRLILSLVETAQQTIAPRAFVETDARVVSRGDFLTAHAQRHSVERGELQTAVARDARDGRLAFQITSDERLDHVALELALQIQNVERKSQILRHAPRVVHVVERAAAAGKRLAALVHAQAPTLIPQLHREADKLVPLLLQNRSRRRGVNAAAHCNHNLHKAQKQ